MRKGEILGLDWERVNFEDGLIYLEGKHQKNGKVGSVPINLEARKALLSRKRFRDENCPDSPWVFCHKGGERLQAVKRSFASACKKAGLEGFRRHDLRHTCAAWLVQKGIDIRSVCEYLESAQQV